jgi:hypothetical protein
MVHAIESSGKENNMLELTFNKGFLKSLDGKLGNNYYGTSF